MKYNFDEVVSRVGNFSIKYDDMKAHFGREDLIPMWIADMDFKTADPIIDAIRKRAEQGIYGYTSRPDSYYEAVGGWLRKRHGWNVEPERMAHSPGVVSTLSILMKEFTKPGDKIIIQPPVYHPFFHVVQSNNREVVENPLKIVNGEYKMDYENLEEVAKGGAKILILCNPHNPIGRVWTKEELIKLGEICLKYNIKVISDEIHSDLMLREHKHTPFAMISEEFRKICITCVSPSKTFNLAGLQASIVIFPNKEERDQFESIMGVISIDRNNCFSLVAIEAAYNYGEEWLEQLLNYLEGNIDFVNQYCAEKIPKLKPNRAEGTYFVWINCKELGMDVNELHKFMIDEARIAFNDGAMFGTQGEGYVRMNVACPRVIIEQALERLKTAIDRVQPTDL